jgi:hypothetical protein
MSNEHLIIILTKFDRSVGDHPYIMSARFFGLFLTHAPTQRQHK